MECFGVMLKKGENGFHLNLITVIKQVMFGIFIVSGGFVKWRGLPCQIELFRFNSSQGGDVMMFKK